jgi:uncharacterized repeat protein (TIGR03803 family)
VFITSLFTVHLWLAEKTFARTGPFFYGYSSMICFLGATRVYLPRHPRKRRIRACLFTIATILPGFLSAQAASFKVLHSFATNSSPSTALVQGADGAFYGTTRAGGAEGNGSIYRVTGDGVFTTLFSFTEHENGAFPSDLLLGADGAFYGTTGRGGPVGWYGTVFRFTTNGGLENLAFFHGTDGANPLALAQGGDGAFYGTTASGGPYTNHSIYGDGTVFRVTTNGVLSCLAFLDGTNGWAPRAGLVQARKGEFFGTATHGGAFTNENTDGYGTVFKVNTKGVLTTLFSFALTNGAFPVAPLVEGRDGMLYGTASSGGTNGGGTVFRITTSGSFETLASFQNNVGTTALGPAGGLVQGNDGAFYGTTTQGFVAPDRGGGSIFRITTNGLLSRLYSFAVPLEGTWPATALVLGRDGAFYGTCTYGGGPENGGTLFRIDISTRMLPLERSSTGGIKVSFEGLPFTAYTILRAPEVSGPWVPVWVLAPDTNTIASFWWDAMAPLNQAYYRVMIP